MAENEESEIMDSVGMLARTITGSGLQAKEAAHRREQTRAQQAQAEEASARRGVEMNHREEAQMASGLRQVTYNREFWRTASSETIADHVTVASHLAPRHPDARMAAMHSADVLRNDFGINIEQMNKDHPGSLEARHFALRDALDDYFNKQSAEVDADQARVEAQQQDQGPEKTQAEAENQPTEAVPTPEAEEQATAAASTPGGEQETTNLSERSEATQSAAEAGSADAEAAQAGKSEQQNLAAADRAGAEVRQDREHARAEEATGGRQPDPYQRVSSQELQEIRKLNPELANVRRRQAESYPMSAKTAMNGQSPKTNKPARGATQTQAKPQEIAR